MTRIRVNNQQGFTAGPLTNGAGTFNFGQAPGFPTIAAPDYAALELEPGTPSYEVVYVTAYTAGATSATIQRGQEGTAGVAHLSGVQWRHGPTAADFDWAVLASGTFAPGEVIDEAALGATWSTPIPTQSGVYLDVGTGLILHPNTTQELRFVAGGILTLSDGGGSTDITVNSVPQVGLRVVDDLGAVAAILEIEKYQAAILHQPHTWTAGRHSKVFSPPSALRTYKLQVSTTHGVVFFGAGAAYGPAGGFSFNASAT